MNTTPFDALTPATSGPTLGASALRRRLSILTGLPLISFGIYNRRCVVQCGASVDVGALTCRRGHGISRHACGRGVDGMTHDPALHEAMVGWGTTDEAGAYGVNEIVSGQHPDYPGQAMRWTAGAGWRPYTGPSRHTDHVHFSISLDASLRPGPIAPPPVKPLEATEMFRLFRLYGYNRTVLVGPTGVLDPLPGGPGLQAMVNAGVIVPGQLVAAGRPWNEWITVLRSDNDPNEARAAWNLVTGGLDTPETNPSEV